MHAGTFARTAAALALMVAAATTGSTPTGAQTSSSFAPVTDAMLQNPDPADWLMWRRTLDGWGYSPLDQIDRENVDRIRMVWTRALGPGLQQGTPLVYDGVIYMPNPRDVIQAIDAESGDLLWEYRRDRPDDLGDYLIASLIDTNRNLAIWNNLIIDTSTDDYVFALDATTGSDRTRPRACPARAVAGYRDTRAAAPPPAQRNTPAGWSSLLATEQPRRIAGGPRRQS